MGTWVRGRAEGATGIGVNVKAAVSVGLAVAGAGAEPVGTTVGVGGFNRFGAINKNAPKATRLAKIHKIVVKLGKREKRLFKINPLLV